MKQTLILAAGWGFDHRFWQPLSTELQDFNIVYDSQSYFGQVGSDTVYDRPIVCIGHSYGFARLVEKYASAENVIGFVSICGFLQFGSACPNIHKKNINMQLAFKHNPNDTLKVFYRKCGLKNWPYMPNNYSLLYNDLSRINTIEFSPPIQPVLDICAAKDLIISENVRKIFLRRSRMINETKKVCLKHSLLKFRVNEKKFP